MQQLPQSKKIAIMLAVMSALFFSSINQTTVGTAMPKIISSLGGMEYYSWVFTIYLLTGSISAIIVGKLSDIYGRKPFLISGILVFIIGSFINGFSQNIVQLIIFRGIQGIGGGMILSLSFAAVGDIFPPRERGRWQGLMMSVFGVSSIFGPTLGGWIVDHLEWHWVFWVFLPFGAIALVMISVMFPALPKREQEPIDFLGSFLLVLIIVPLLLAFSWAGVKYPWLSLQILGLLGFSVIALVFFRIVERSAKSPVLPLSLFQNSIFNISNLVMFILGAAMFGTVMNVPILLQGVMGISATFSGFFIMPMTLSNVFASAVTGHLITKTGKYKNLALSGLLIMAAGMGGLSLLDSDTSFTIVTIYMVITGFGLGMSLPVFALTVQNAVDHNMLGVVTASSQLFRQIGGTIGVSVMGFIMNAQMQAKLALSMPAKTALPAEISPAVAEKFAMLENPQILMNHEQLSEIGSSLPSELQPYFSDYVLKLKEALNWSLSSVFLAVAGLLLAGFVLSLFLRELPLRTTFTKKKSDDVIAPLE